VFTLPVEQLLFWVLKKGISYSWKIESSLVQINAETFANFNLNNNLTQHYTAKKLIGLQDFHVYKKGIWLAFLFRVIARKKLIGLQVKSNTSIDLFFVFEHFADKGGGSSDANVSTF